MSVNVKTENGLTKLAGLYDSEEISAEGVAYDNTETGMTADNVQDAIDEVFQSVSSGKGLIADAITDKGVPTSATDTFATMATNIGQISGGDSNHIKTIIASSTREGNNFLKTRVKAGKYICILEQGQLAGVSPTGLTSSGTEIFSFQSSIANSRYCFIKEFELEEDGWIECSGGFQESIYLTTRRYIFKVDFDLNENILADIKIENAYDITKTLSTQDDKVFICVMNTEETVDTDITSSQDITEKIDYGCACFVYDENNGNDYELSATNTTASWTTNVYWAFSIV